MRLPTETVPVGEAVGEAMVEALSFPGGDLVPNNPALPIVVMRGVLVGGLEPECIAALYERNGWTGSWTWEVYGYHHFHPDAHEALAVIRGSARLMLGGPQGQDVEVRAGDVLVLPAGAGHKQVEKRDGFTVCGAYPRGQERYATLRAERPFAPGVPTQIAAVPLPEADPIFGAEGPLMQRWRLGDLPGLRG